MGYGEEMAQRQIDRATRFGSPTGTASGHWQGTQHIKNYNPYLKEGDYRKLFNFLVNHLKYSVSVARSLIADDLIKEGKLPVVSKRALTQHQYLHLKDLIAKSGLKLEGHNHKEMERKYQIQKEKEQNNMSVEKEVKTMFKVEREEEGEKVLVLTRGMVKEAVAVSYSYPHYRKEGFYAERKSNVFQKENDIEKILVDMDKVFEALAVTLNNLLSADKLDADAYNKVMDGYEPFILEALDFSEIEPMLDNTRGLKGGRKKRISNTRGAKKK